MAGSVFGTLFRITTWGESHGKGLGVIIDGCPAGLALTEDDFSEYMARRRPNAGPMSTKRKESDRVEILSGTFEGKTTGTPISLVVWNEDQHSKDYSNIKDTYRPGHADFGFDAKYGFRDYRGGGRSSGRETVGRVAAGAIASKMLKQLGITFETRVTAIGGMPFEDSAEYLKKCREEGDSCGSEVLCIAHGVPAGLGDPVFDKLDADLGKAVFSIGAVKAVEIGDGIKTASMKGSEDNDGFRMESGRITPITNHAGGILGGISDGADLKVRVYFKPTPSISKEQQTVTSSGENTIIAIHGRHDPVIGPRAAVVVESMVAIVLVDAMLRNMTARMSYLTDFYRSKN